MAQYLVPITSVLVVDVVDEFDGNTDIHQSVDESPTANDADYIKGTGAGGETVDFQLSSGTDPVSSAGHIIRVRSYHVDAADPIVNAFLYDGGNHEEGTLIATMPPITPGGSAADDTYTLDGAEADAITDYSTLFLQLELLTGKGGGTVFVTQAHLEIPSVAGGQPTMRRFGGTPGMGQGQNIGRSW